MRDQYWYIHTWASIGFVQDTNATSIYIDFALKFL